MVLVFGISGCTFYMSFPTAIFKVQPAAHQTCYCGTFPLCTVRTPPSFHTCLSQSILFGWYAFYILYTVVQIGLVFKYPDIAGIITRSFNLGGWLIATTGITDCVQTLWVIRLKSNTTFGKSNKKFLQILALVYILAISTWAVLLAIDAPILVYRAISCTFLVLESALFVPILYKTRTIKGFKGQVIYFTRFASARPFALNTCASPTYA